MSKPYLKSDPEGYLVSITEVEIERKVGIIKEVSFSVYAEAGTVAGGIFRIFTVACPKLQRFV